jgi:hypothetical protein
MVNTRKRTRSKHRKTRNQRGSGFFSNMFKSADEKMRLKVIDHLKRNPTMNILAECALAYVMSFRALLIAVNINNEKRDVMGVALGDNIVAELKALPRTNEVRPIQLFNHTLNKIDDVLSTLKEPGLNSTGILQPTVKKYRTELYSKILQATPETTEAARIFSERDARRASEAPIGTSV